MQKAIPCTLMRGGTSRGPYFRREDLPEDRDAMGRVLLAAMGSPDARQIDGIGGATTLTDGDSKVGRVVSEANGTLVLNSPEDGRIEIPINRIRSRERAPSAMPEGLTEMISRAEMRDLIEALVR